MMYLLLILFQDVQFIILIIVINTFADVGQLSTPKIVVSLSVSAKMNKATHHAPSAPPQPSTSCTSVPQPTAPSSASAHQPTVDSSASALRQRTANFASSHQSTATDERLMNEEGKKL